MSIKALIFLFLLIFGLIFLFWAFKIEPNLLVIKHYHVKDKQLSGLRIVFASDFHIGKKDLKRLKRIVSAIKKQQADLFFWEEITLMDTRNKALCLQNESQKN